MKQELSESFLSQYYWQKHGDAIPWIFDSTGRPLVYDGIITAQASGGDFAVGARDDASVEALSSTKKVIIKPKNGTVAIELRFRYNGIEGDQHILRLYVAAGVDHYRWVETLTLDQGTQIHTVGSAGTGIKFIDVVGSAGEQWLTPTIDITTTNEIGGYTMNMHGYDRLWLVATTLDTANSGTTLHVDWKQL